jgi:hypothetical protein
MNRRQLEMYASSGREAYGIIDDLFVAVFGALHKDARFATVRLQEFELLLANVRADAKRRLFDQLHNRVHFDDVDGGE